MIELSKKYLPKILSKQLEILKNSKIAKKEDVESIEGQTSYFDYSFSSPFGVIILAGGQASRLGLTGPKGCFNLSENETLFSYLIEKLKGCDAYLAIMTSESNHKETVDFFDDHHFFDLGKDRIDFFIQESWPVVDQNNQWVLKNECEIFDAPLGNGSMYEAFCNSSIINKWKDLKISAVNILPVDNLLADPKDLNLLGAVEQGYDLAVRGIKKEHTEKVGMLIKQSGSLKVIEYSECEIEIDTLAYSGLFAMSLNFLEEASKLELPIHIAHKEGICFSNGEYVPSKIIKFEKFIFDAFYKAEKFIVLNSCRKKYFCPLKDKKGPYGIEAIREIYKKVTI